MNKIFKILFDTFLELLYPEKGICFICDKYDKDIGKEDYICEECRKKLEFVDKNNYIKSGHHFEKAIATLKYKGIIKKAIYKYKYGKKAYMYKAFGNLLVQTMKRHKEIEFDFVVPVPLHRSRMIDRGFNQSELLAKYISKYYNIPLNTKNLIRKRKTKAQNKLNGIERQNNIKDAFATKNGQIFKGKRILLIDDIYTTGITVDECSKVLLQSGSKGVVVLTLATAKEI